MRRGELALAAYRARLEWRRRETWYVYAVELSEERSARSVLRGLPHVAASRWYVGQSRTPGHRFLQHCWPSAIEKTFEGFEPVAFEIVKAVHSWREACDAEWGVAEAFRRMGRVVINAPRTATEVSSARWYGRPDSTHLRWRPR